MLIESASNACVVLVLSALFFFHFDWYDTLIGRLNKLIFFNWLSLLINQCECECECEWKQKQKQNENRERKSKSKSKMQCDTWCMTCFSD